MSDALIASRRQWSRPRAAGASHTHVLLVDAGDVSASPLVDVPIPFGSYAGFIYDADGIEVYGTPPIAITDAADATPAGTIAQVGAHSGGAGFFVPDETDVGPYTFTFDSAESGTVYILVHVHPDAAGAVLTDAT